MFLNKATAPLLAVSGIAGSAQGTRYVGATSSGATTSVTPVGSGTATTAGSSSGTGTTGRETLTPLEPDGGRSIQAKSSGCSTAPDGGPMGALALALVALSRRRRPR